MIEDENDSANRARVTSATTREQASSDEDSEERATPRLRAFYAWFGSSAIRSFRIYKRDGYVITVYDP